ncbi:T9SS type A sorting domain-containing protein [Coprobacter secundus]|uniref:T9SS type A sorting domain-containing protein n=1 Tax=Coprobacter secundus TaxID=1501392 RepID=UPI003520FD3E
MRYYKKYVYVIAILSVALFSESAGLLAQISVYPNSCFCGSLDDYSNSWIANTGGVPKTHVPHSITSIYVHPDGRVVTICGWDEGGTNVGVFKNNQIICIPQNSGTGSYGRNSGKEVTMDDKYIYQLMRFNGRSGGNDELNGNGRRKFPPKTNGVEWQVIHRYDAETGLEASFPCGYGPGGNMLFIAEEENRQATGIAVTDKYLIVSLPKDPTVSEMSDSLLVYDKETMSDVPLRRFKVNNAGYLYVDKKGYVWMKEGNKIVPYNLMNGTILERSVITLPEGTDIRSFSVDTKSGKERILMANSGKDLNILIYTNIYKAPELSSTFGEKGGILAKSGNYKQGEAGPLRFEGPTGVGVDDNGNIYISNMFVNSSGATLCAYKEATKELLWKQEGLVFTATADFDQTQLNRVYCTERIYDIDYSKNGCRIDKFIATTVDPFAFPKDMRLEPNPPYPLKTGVFKRKIKGKDYIFVSNMYSTGLAGYRFDPDNYGYIAVPFMKVLVDEFSFWNDKNGDGQPQSNEITYSKVANTFSQYVDKNGNLWVADRNKINGLCSFRLWKVQGEDSNGVLQYATEETYMLPSFITDVSRVLYDIDRDELIIGCYTTERPWDEPSLWGQVGTTILVYDKVKEKLLDKINPETWEYTLKIDIPFAVKDASGKFTGEDAKCLAFAGDYIFTQQQQGGKINLYNRFTGDYAGQLGPTDVVEGKSGWTDFTYAMNARKNIDGTYEILAEENAYAKVVHYKINSMSASMTRLGDLYPYKIQVLNKDGLSFAPELVREGEPIQFQVWVQNIERGEVTNRRPSDPTRCKVRFRLYDADTDELLYTAYSVAYEKDLVGGESVLMTVDPSMEMWTYISGNYKLQVDVNYMNLGKECDATNNIGEFSFGGEALPSSLESIELDKLFRVYPNPATTEIVFDGQMAQNNYTVNLLSSSGSIVMSRRFYTFDKGRLDVSNVDSGIYFLQILLDNQVINRKIIIRK